mgnify:CR=1 FL=1
MSVELMLGLSKPSFLIINERARKDFVIGVPHHAPAGTEKLPCPEHGVSDENAGFLGHCLADILDCCSVIACNYTIDVNKRLRSDYAVQIASWNPSVLVEIHGHGGNNAKYDIEISCGSKDRNENSKKLAESLSEEFKKKDELKYIRVCGDFHEIYFKASRTLTICDSRWLGFHIELPSSLRIPENSRIGKPNPAGYIFCSILADILLKSNWCDQ